MLQYRPKTYKFINKGLGSAPGKLLLNENAAMSSLMERTPLTAVPVKDRYEVEITTLDKLLSTLKVKLPIGLKIDTEGFELEVLRGMKKRWESVEFIICEATVRKRFENSYVFSGLVGHMAHQGFAFYNILNEIQKRPRFYDVLFVRSDSALLT